MSIDFSKIENKKGDNISNDVNTELDQLKYDIVKDRKNLNEELVNSKEIDDIVSSIDISDITSLTYFGDEPAKEVSKAADVVLSQMNMKQMDRTNDLLSALDELMRKIDIKEIYKDKSMFENLFNNIRNKIDRLLSKYNYVGQEIDRIYINLKLTENDIKKSNDLLKNMFDDNVKYYHELVKYILAGEQALNEIKKRIDQKQKEYAETNNNAIQLELNELNNSFLVLKQRVVDLKMAENTSMQSIPLLNSHAFANVNLLRKINSCFIITLPIFKQQLAQAIIIKKQKLQAKMLEKLDEKTNEMIVDNAKNSVEMAKNSINLATSSAIKIETLEESWKTIVQGIEETKKMQEQAFKKCQEDAQKLENIKSEFDEKFHIN